MSITDELIEWAESLAAISPRGQRKSPLWVQLIDIADRIDAEHERAVCDARHDALYGANESDMADLGWVRLPVDADGETIRLGDDMETLLVGHEGEHSRVEWISLTADGWEVDGEPPTSMLHHHAPTVEDVLREFALEVCGEPALTIRSGVVEEYAAKLRLAGES